MDVTVSALSNRPMMRSAKVYPSLPLSKCTGTPAQCVFEKKEIMYQIDHKMKGGTSAELVKLLSCTHDAADYIYSHFVLNFLSDTIEKLGSDSLCGVNLELLAALKFVKHVPLVQYARCCHIDASSDNNSVALDPSEMSLKGGGGHDDRPSSRRLLCSFDAGRTRYLKYFNQKGDCNVADDNVLSVDYLDCALLHCGYSLEPRLLAHDVFGAYT
ncbi:hypothetical protein AKJ16_DCAP02008 [Drosera capensis]